MRMSETWVSIQSLSLVLASQFGTSGAKLSNSRRFSKAKGTRVAIFLITLRRSWKPPHEWPDA